MAYDRQLIIEFLSGDPSDKLIMDNAKAMDKRARSAGLKSHIVTLPCGSGLAGRVKDHFRLKSLQHELGKLTDSSRVYIQGHGDWQSQKVADWGAHFSADYLVACGLPAVKMISILACEAARDRGTSNQDRIAQSADSYASKFHKRLYEKHKLETIVAARTLCVVPLGPLALKGLGIGKEHSGRKMTSDENDDAYKSVHKRTESKLVFSVKGGQQVREWMY